MRRFLGAGLVLGLLTAVGLAQDGPVTINISKGEVGNVTRETKSDAFATKISITAMGQTMDKAEARTIKMEFTDEVLEKAAGSKKPTKTKRTIISAEATEDGQPKDIGLAGKTILIETKDNKTTYTFADGSKLSEDQLKFLDANQKDDGRERPEFDEVILPKNPVKAGETWKIDTAAIAKVFDDNFVIDTAKSTATGTLTKVYDKGGRKFGVLDIKLDLVVSRLGQGAQAIPLKDGSKMQVEGILDICIDGTAEAGTMTMTMKGDFEGEFMGATLKLTMTGKNTATAEPVKK